MIGDEEWSVRVVRIAFVKLFATIVFLSLSVGIIYLVCSDIGLI